MLGTIPQLSNQFSSALPTRFDQFLHSISTIFGKKKNPSGAPSFQIATSISSVLNTLSSFLCVIATPGLPENITDQIFECPTLLRRCVAVPASIQIVLDDSRSDDRHQGLTPCTRRFRRSRTISGNVWVRSPSTNARAGINSMFGGQERQIGSSAGGPSPYHSKAQPIADKARYEPTCLKASAALASVLILSFTSTSKGFPRKDSSKSDQNARSAPRSRSGDSTTRSVPEFRMASATVFSKSRPAPAASD